MMHATAGEITSAGDDALVDEEEPGSRTSHVESGDRASDSLIFNDVASTVV